MKKLNFNFKIKDLAQKEIPDSDIYLFIANNLIHPEFKEGDAIKKYNLATRIYNDKYIEVDDADFKLIKKSTDLLAPLAKAQILLYLDSIKEEK